MKFRFFFFLILIQLKQFFDEALKCHAKEYTGRYRPVPVLYTFLKNEF
jgi:hypothetical protein